MVRPVLEYFTKMRRKGVYLDYLDYLDWSVTLLS